MTAPPRPAAPSLLDRVERRVRKTLGVPRRRPKTKDPAELVAAYLAGGRLPWTPGYLDFHRARIAEALADPPLNTAFAAGDPLPAGYGHGLDERVVEWPWVLSRLGDPADGAPAAEDRPGRPARLLDAGSALNHPFLLADPRLAGREVTIATLAPETDAAWKEGISYVFCDLRNSPFRDGWFDEVVSVSTLEHVGMNNALYSADDRFAEHENDDHLRAAADLARATRPGGRLLITVPFGRRESFGWFQQFDGPMVDRLIDAVGATEATQRYYRYSADGWGPADRAACEGAVYFNLRDARGGKAPAEAGDPAAYDADRAAAARAVACLEFVK